MEDEVTGMGLRTKLGTRGYLVVAVALIVMVSFAMPAFGAPSVSSLIKKATTLAKGADKRSREALAAAQQPPPRFGQPGEAGALHVQVARVVDDATPAPAPEGERDRQRDEPFRLPDVGARDSRCDRPRPAPREEEVAERLERATEGLPEWRGADIRGRQPGRRQPARPWRLGDSNHREAVAPFLRSQPRLRTGHDGDPMTGRGGRASDLPGSGVGQERVVEEQHDMAGPGHAASARRR
jgi:hypothetical protein